MKRIPANTSEINLYSFLGEALLKIQILEQALSHSITIKMNPAETKEKADEFLKKYQHYTLGQAINIAKEKKLYNLALQDGLKSFLEQRNWLVHSVLIGNEENFNTGNLKEELFEKIKSISDEAEDLKHLIEYDMIDFCTSKGKNMSKMKYKKPDNIVLFRKLQMNYKKEEFPKDIAPLIQKCEQAILTINERFVD